MARLVEVLNQDYITANNLEPDQVYSKLPAHNIPVTVDDTLIVCETIMKNESAVEMVMEINIENNIHLTNAVLTEHVPTKEEYQTFMGKYKRLSGDELKQALKLSYRDVIEQMSKMVPCVGCRRSAESAYLHATLKGYRAYYPFQTSQDGSLYMAHNMLDFKSIFSLFVDPSDGMRSLLASFNKFSTFKKGKRCNIHSLDSHRGRSIEAWMDVWDYMSPNCRKEIGTVKRAFFAETLEGYLRKHRFCNDCKSTVQKAYKILTLAVTPNTEPGYMHELYSGINYNAKYDEFHMPWSTEFIGSLISRAVPELSGTNRRERHAKTMETAQEEILTCLGVCVFERLHRIQQRFREEERGWEIVMCVAIEALRQSFELALHAKSGMATLQWLTEQEEQEKAKKQKKVLKKQRRKEKKLAEEDKPEPTEPEVPVGAEIPTTESEINYESSADTEPTVVEVITKEVKKLTLDDKEESGLAKETSPCSSENQDCGYASGNNNNRSGTSTPLGSVAAFSERLCNHAQVPCETEHAPPPVVEIKPTNESNEISKEIQPPKASKKKPRGPMLFSSVSFRTLLPHEVLALSPPPAPHLTLEEQLDENELADEPIPLGERELNHLRDPRVARKRRKIRANLILQYNNWMQGVLGDKFNPVVMESTTQSALLPKPAPDGGDKAEKSAAAGGGTNESKTAPEGMGGKENKKPNKGGGGGGGARNSKAKQAEHLRRYKGKNRH